MSVSTVGLPTSGAYAPLPLPPAPSGGLDSGSASWGSDSFSTQAPAPYAAPSVDSYATTGLPADPNAVGQYSNQGVDSYATNALPADPGAMAPYGDPGLQAQNAQPAGGILGGIGLGRLASWGAGAFAAFKWVLPMLGKSPAGWMVAGVIGGGAFVGNWLYSKLTGK